MTSATPIAERYIALWNETDATRRQDLIADTFTADARYLDPLMQGEGHQGIDAMVAAAQAKFAGHRFALRGTPEGHHDRLRFSWTLAAVATAPVAAGTDFALLSADGRLRRVTGFLDALPPGP